MKEEDEEVKNRFALFSLTESKRRAHAISNVLRPTNGTTTTTTTGKMFYDDGVYIDRNVGAKKRKRSENETHTIGKCATVELINCLPANKPLFSSVMMYGMRAFSVCIMEAKSERMKKSEIGNEARKREPKKAQCLGKSLHSLALSGKDNKFSLLCIRFAKKKHTK